MSDSISCRICATPSLPAVTFVEHLFGKRHAKRSKARTGLDDSINKCSILVHSRGADIKNFGEQLVFKYLEFNVVDAHFVQTRMFIEFKTPEDAEKALKAKINVNGLNFWLTQPRFDRRRSKQGNVVKPTGYVPKLSPDLLKQLDSIDSTASIYDLDNLMLQLVNEIELKPRDKVNREEIRAAVENFLNPLFPNGRTYIFGSSANNLGFTGCDVDMVADLGYDCWSGQPKAAAEQDADKITKFLAKELRRRRMGTNVVAIGRARVPIVKFHDTMYNLEVDLSFKNGMPIYNTQLIELYSKSHTIVKPFMMFIRYWAKVQNLAGGGQPTFLLTNYCLCMMLLFWLMIREVPIVPCVKELQEGVEPVYIDGCNCSFRPNVDEWRRKYHNITLMDLVIEFFEFYGQMNCKEYVISPLEGRLLTRASLKPKGSRSFGDKSTIQINTPLCVQDPFDTSHNISRGFMEKPLNVFQLKCLKAQKICKDIQDSKAAFTALFADYNLEEVELTEEVIKEATVIDEVASVASSEESVELLQELESLERSGVLQELLENTKIDKDTEDKRLESDSQGSNDSVIISEKSSLESDSQGSDDSVIVCEKSEDSDSKNKNLCKASSTPVRKVLGQKDEIIILREIAKAEFELVNLDDSADFIEEVNGVKDNIEIEPETSEQTYKNSVIKSTKSGNSLSPKQDSEFYAKDAYEFNPINEEFRFTFELYSKILFSLDENGNILPSSSLNSNSVSHSKSKDECLSDLYSFILKRVLLCEILDDTITLPQNIQKKRKISEGNSSPNKLLKVSDCESVSVKSDFTLISSYKCKTTYKVWEGRKKLLKEATESSANPLQSELFITKKLDKSDCNIFNIDFETRIWREKSNFTHYLVTVHQSQSEETIHKGQLDETKLGSKFTSFYDFFAKFVVNLLHKVDGFNFRNK